MKLTNGSQTTVELWDGRKVPPGETVEVADSEGEVLKARDPETWGASRKAAAPAAKVE